MLLNGKDAVQALVQNYQGLTQKEKGNYNKANTVNAFIKSLFEALGWDFSNIDEVEAEKTIVKGRVDYVFKVKKVSKLCVEVKSLRHDLIDEHREQAISYAYNKGLTWAILTNFGRTQVFNADVKSDLKAAQFGCKLKDAEEGAGGKYYWGPFDAPGVWRFLSYEVLGRYSPPGHHWSWQTTFLPAKNNLLRPAPSKVLSEL